jgi:anti-anti-sigma regulatory factor
LSNPSITVHTDTDRHILAVNVAGPLVEPNHSALLRDVCCAAPSGYGLVVNLSSVSRVSEHGLATLRDIVLAASAQGQQVVFVCTELMLRTELVLADLDTLAPVVAAHEQAVTLVSFAA